MEANFSARVSIGGTIEYRDKDGNIIKSVPFNGSAPLTQEEDDGDSSERGQESRT